MVFSAHSLPGSHAARRQAFVCGLICWAAYAVPFQLIGAAQFLIGPDTQSPTVWQMAFTVSGCCVMPLVLLMNVFWIRRAWSRSFPHYSIILTALLLVSYCLTDGGLI